MARFVYEVPLLAVLLGILPAASGIPLPCVDSIIEPGVVCFMDNFDDGTLIGWETVSGAWTVEAGELSTETQEGGLEAWIYASCLLLPRPSRVETDVTFLAQNGVVGKHGGFMLSAEKMFRNQTTGYEFDWLDPKGYRIIEWNTTVTEHDFGGSPPTLGQPQRWAVLIEQDRIEFSVDGVQVAALNTTRFGGPFYFGYWAYANQQNNAQHIHFDNLVLRNPLLPGICVEDLVQPPA